MDGDLSIESLGTLGKAFLAFGSIGGHESPLEKCGSSIRAGYRKVKNFGFMTCTFQTSMALSEWGLFRKRNAARDGPKAPLPNASHKRRPLTAMALIFLANTRPLPPTSNSEETVVLEKLVNIPKPFAPTLADSCFKNETAGRQQFHLAKPLWRSSAPRSLPHRRMPRPQDSLRSATTRPESVGRRAD